MVLKIKTWFLTYPQNDASKEALLSELKDIDHVLEYLIAIERHQDGNAHLHAYVKFKTGVFLKDAPDTFNVLDKRGDYQPTRSCKAVVKYCSKKDDYICNFDLDSYLSKKKKLSVATIKNKSARQALIDGDITIQAIRNYNLARSILVEPYSHPTTRGYWIWGPPGTGKSHVARVAFPDAYMKSQNKWWDGYEGQHAVILDDLDTNVLGHYLKIWADKYACQGEVKGGSVQLAHRILIVTSNYHPSALFDCESMNEAVSRRFIIINKIDQSQPISFNS